MLAMPLLAESGGGGRILAVGSFAGTQGLPRVAPYSASKHAVFGYFNSLRHDLRASEDERLRKIAVTTGVLGAFSTQSFLTGTAGYINPATAAPPQVAATALLTGVARRHSTVYTPWLVTWPASLLHALAPEPVGELMRAFLVYFETK